MAASEFQVGLASSEVDHEEERSWRLSGSSYHRQKCAVKVSEALGSGIVVDSASIETSEVLHSTLVVFGFDANCSEYHEGCRRKRGG